MSLISLYSFIPIVILDIKYFASIKNTLSKAILDVILQTCSSDCDRNSISELLGLFFYIYNLKNEAVKEIRLLFLV